MKVNARFGPPVYYRGIKMRSRLEARFAELLDLFELEWDYEPADISLGKQRFYRPDFWLPENRTWVETKGRFDDDDWSRFIDFACDRFEMDEDVALVMSHGTSLLMRDDGYTFDALSHDDPMRRWSAGHFAAAHISACKNCQRFRIDRDRPAQCRMCGYFVKEADVVLSMQIFAVRGVICPDDAELHGKNRPGVVVSENSSFALGIGGLGTSFNLNSFGRAKELKDHALQVTELSGELATAVEHFERNEPPPTMPHGASEERMLSFMEEHAAWEVRYQNAIAAATGGKPGWQTWEDATGSEDHNMAIVRRGAKAYQEEVRQKQREQLN